MINKKLSRDNLYDAAQHNDQNNHNTLSSQRQRLLAYLKSNLRITTDEARTKLDIMHPAGRIRELKSQGFAIICERHSLINSNNKKHNMGVYYYTDNEKGVHHA